MLRGALRQEFHSRRHDDPGLGHHLRRARALLRQVRVHGRRSPARRATSAGRSSPAAIRSRRRAQHEYPLPPLTPILASGDVHTRRRRTSAIIRSRAPPPTRRAPTPIPTARSSARASTAAIASASAARRTRKAPAVTVIPIAMQQSELRAAHGFVGDQGAEGSDGKRVTGVDLHERAQRRGIRAARRHGAAVRLCDQQRAPDAAVAASASPTIRSRRQA